MLNNRVICEICGAIVHEDRTFLHTEWHKEIDNALLISEEDSFTKENRDESS